MKYWPFSDVTHDLISIYDGPDVFLADLEAASKIERTLFAAYWCQAEVLNGGLLQFYANSTGVLAPEAAAAFDDLGLPNLAGLLRESSAWFGDSYPRNRDVREAMLEALVNGGWVVTGSWPIDTERPGRWFSTVDIQYPAQEGFETRASSRTNAPGSSATPHGNIRLH